MGARQQWRGQGRRLRAARISLEITKQQVPAVCRFDQDAQQKSIWQAKNLPLPDDLSLGRLLDGEGILNGKQVGRKAPGKAAIPPAIGPNLWRHASRLIAIFGSAEWGR